MITDQSHRQTALNPTKSFIVQAPAGSGKTELLTRRILNLLATQCSQPEEILAITFTKKAAEEMRTRVIESLELATHPEPQKNNYRHENWTLAKSALTKDTQQQWHLIKNPQRLRIMTIDGFCRYLAQQSPLKTHIDASTQMIQGDTFYQEVCEQFLQDCYHDKSNTKSISILLYQLDNQSELAIQLLIALLKTRDQWITPLLQLKQTKQATIEILEANLQAVCRELIEDTKKLLTPSLTQSLLQCLAFSLQQHKSNLDKPNDEISTFKALAKLITTQSGNLIKTISIRQGFPKPEDATNQVDKEKYLAYKTLMGDCITEIKNIPKILKKINILRQIPNLKYSKEQAELIQALTQLLPQLFAYLQQTFIQHQAADYLYIATQAQYALQNDYNNQTSPSRVLMKLDYQINHLLIDEFQDTSLSQYQLFETLTAPWTPSESKTIFLVGDPMQSIYQFRQAQVSLFARLMRQQQWGNLTLKSLRLTSNFRSCRNLILHFNSLYKNIFPNIENLNTGEITYTQATTPSNSKKYSNKPKRWNLYATEQQQAEAIITHIKQLQNTQPTANIAILVRSRSQLNFLLPELQKHNVNYQTNEIESLLEQIVISDLLQLTRALINLNDRIAWLAILRAPWCGLELSELLKLQAINSPLVWQQVQQGHSLLRSTSQPRLAHFIACLTQARQNYQRTTLAELLKITWINLGAETIYTQEEQKYATYFFMLLTSLENTSSPFVTHFVTQLEKQLQQAKISSIAEENCIETQTKEHALAVQIMTIHHAKGLEFDHVLCINLNKKPVNAEKPLLVLNQDEQQRLLCSSLNLHDNQNEIYEFIAKKAQAKSQAENCRQLYVAATRAKLTLNYFATIEEKKRPFKNSLLALAWPHLDAEEKIVITAKDNHEEDSKEDEHKPRYLHRLKDEWYQKHLNSNVTHSIPRGKVSSTISLTTNMTNDEYGTIIHRYFAYLGLTSSKEITPKSLEQQAHTFWKKILTQKGFDDREIEQHLLGLIQRTQSAFQDPMFHWIIQHHTDAHNELALQYTEDNEIKTCIIDRTFIDEKNTCWIIDYKTHIFSQDTSQKRIKSYMEKHYTHQLNTYQKVMTALKPNQTIKTAIYLTSLGIFIRF